MEWLDNSPVHKRARAKELEEQRKQEEKERRRLAKVLDQEASYYGEKIITVAANRGFIHVLRGRLEPNVFELLLAGKEVIKRIKFTHILMDEERIWFRVNANDLPTPITLSDLYDKLFLETLSIALTRPVKFIREVSAGAFFIVERDGSVGGIPNYVKMSDAFNWIPANADHLSFCVGLSENRQPVIASLSSLPHILMAGNTRAGKSVNLNNIICTIISRGGPDKTRFVLVDLKRGVEFAKYQGIPHLLEFGSKTPGIAKAPDEAIKALRMVIEEMNSRYTTFESVGATNIEEYNQVADQRLPSYVLIVDEMSLILFSPDKELVKLGRYLLNEVLSMGAAAGIHCILCTQDPSRELFPRILKTNCPARICFSTPSIPGSIAMLENKNAHRLSPRGRGVFQLGDIEKQFQGPMITAKMVKNHVKRIIEGYKEKNTEMIRTPELMDMLRWALEHRQGSLAWEPLWNEFGPKGLSQHKIKDMLKKADDGLFEIDGNVYHSPKPKSDRTGRGLVLIRPVKEQEASADRDLLAAD